LEPPLRADLASAGLDRILDELEIPLAPVLAEMESCGMLLDPDQLRLLGTTLESEARSIEAEIWEIAGERFNIGSTKQLQVVLYEKLGLEKGRTIKTGASTDTFTLERLAENAPIAGKVLEYRATTKLKSTYVDALLALVDQDSCRIHTTMNQTGTVSGRISSTDPNLQNIPIRTSQGRQIRKAFVAPPGHVLLSADYSQIELRVLAHITGDAPLTEAFQSGEDVHARTASALFGVAVDAVDKEMRRKAKMTNYAIAYGVSGFGLAKQLGTGTAGDAKEFIERYFQTLPGVKQYMDDTLKEARAKGYAETLLGRRRPLPEINAPKFQDRSAAERTAINHPIQGTAADIMKLAMLAVHAELKRQNLRSRITMQVHDELVFEVPEDEIEAITELAKTQMTSKPAERLGLRVPLVVDVGTGLDWDSAKGSG
jgi:DNA polymerase-1